MILILLLCLLSLGVSACGGGDDGPNSSKPTYSDVLVTYYETQENSNAKTVYATNGALRLTTLPARAGYTFAGLFDDWTGGSMYVDGNGNGMISVTSAITLYAHWTPLTYTLEFDVSDENAGGGVSYFGKIEPFTLATGSFIPYPQFPIGEKDGYNFIGWFAGDTQVSDGAIPFTGANTFNETYIKTAKDGKIVLTPKYAEIEYTVTFDLNYEGAAFETESDASRVYSYFNTGIPEEDYPSPKETLLGNKEFVGWSTVSYRLTPFTGNVTGDTTLYAIWKGFKVVSLDYGKGEIKEAKVYEGDGALTPEKNGYEFVAAYSDSAFSGGTRITLDYNYLKAGTTYYLQFEALTYTVTFVSNCNISVAAISYTIEEEKVLPLTPEKVHYTFAGWCAEEDCSDPPITKISKGTYGNQTYYAKFVGKQIPVSFVSEYASEASKSLRYGEVPEATVPAKGTCPETKAFYGWYDAAEGGNRLSDEKGVFTREFLRDEEGVTFYARYKNIYNVRLIESSDGVTRGIAYCEPALKEYYFEGEAFTARLSLYNEEGYYISALQENGTDVEFESNSAILRCGEVTEEIRFTVTVQAKEFTVSLSYPAEGWCKENSATLTYGESFTLPVPLLSGKKFAGWKAGQDGITVTNASGYSKGVWGYSDVTTLYATFEDSEESFEIIKDEASFLKLYTNPTATYYLTNDIAVSASGNQTRNEKAVTFSGALYGNGFEISGLTGTQGLFQTLTGTVKDVILTVDITVTSSVEVGGVAGVARGATIENVTVNGSIRSNGTGVANMGGIVGFVNGQTSKIIGCENNATVTGSGNSSGGTTGGIVGYIYKTEGFVIENCENNGKVSGTAHYTGGIAGASENNFTMKNTTNRGEVEGSIIAGGILGGAKVGTATIDRCLSTGKVTVKGEPGNKYIGSGKANFINLKPIPVTTANDLIEMKNNDAVETYALQNDIDMEGVEWTPFALAAVLDGRGYKIKNLSFTVTSNAGGGMFASVTGTVKNITFENLNAVYDYTDYSITSYTAYSKAGGIVPALATGTLQNVKVFGEVTAKGPFVKLGGLVGEMTGGTVTNCENSAAVTAEEGDAYAAGIVAFVTGGTVDQAVNRGAVAGGKITVNGSAGGVIAYANTCTLGDLSNYGNVSGATNTGGVVGNTAIVLSAAANYGDVSGASNVGGIVGFFERQGSYSVKGYINYGNITAMGDSAGGIFGRFENIDRYNSTFTLTLSNFTNAGNVSGKIDAGGIFGYLRHSNGFGKAIVNATGLTNTGNVTATEKNAGGLFGSGYIESTSSVVKDSVSSGKITAPYVVGGLAGYISHVTIADCSNVGSKVTATGYETDGTNYNVYLGGYVGSGLNFCSFSGCENAAEIVYTERGRFVGGLAGYAKGSFTGCTNTANITAEKSAYVGGIAGYGGAGSASTGAGLANTGNITGLERVGGIFGAMNVTTLNKCTNSGNITASGEYAGGMVGYSEYTTTVNLRNAGDIAGQTFVGGLFGSARNGSISDSASSGAVQGEFYVGGLAGQIGAIADCSNTGVVVTAMGYGVEGSNYNAYVGGYAGYAGSGSNLENAAKITYSERGRFVGGIMGYSNGTLTNCTNTADITAEKSDYVGGIVGCIVRDWSNTHSNLTNSGNITGKNYVGGIFGSCTNGASNSGVYTLTLTKLINNGAVIASGNYVGGIVGKIYCYNTYYHGTSNVSAACLENSGVVTGKQYVGGLFGEFHTESASAVVDYTQTGTVTGENGVPAEECGAAAPYVGLLCGAVYHFNG